MKLFIGVSAALFFLATHPARAETISTKKSSGLDPKLIKHTVQKKQSVFRKCYESELAKHKNLAGTVTVKFTIASEGKVSKAAVQESTIRSPSVEDCVVGRIRDLVFPKPKNGNQVVVDYPFIFEPA